jgi:nucleotide-binding universal stress UspA family protein
MYKRVLVPLDGSAIAMQVLPYAKLMAKSSGATIELLQALTGYPSELLKQVSHGYVGGDGLPSYPPLIDVWTSIKDRTRCDVKAKLEAVAAPLRVEGFKVETTAAQNDAVGAILVAADQDPDTLITISTHGRSGVGRWVLGRVTDKVVRHATHPTLVVRSREGQVTPATPKLERIILPLDGSEMSSSAIPYAVDLAKALGVGITLVRSISPLAYGDAFVDYNPSVYDDLTAEIQTDVSDYLAQKAGEIKCMGISDVTGQGIDGHPATAILDEVGDYGDRIVVMATHGRAGIGRWVLGSVADRVMRHSPGPVLMVRPREER